MASWDYHLDSGCSALRGGEKHKVSVGEAGFCDVHYLVSDTEFSTYESCISNLLPNFKHRNRVCTPFFLPFFPPSFSSNH